MRKAAFCICDNKGADQPCSNCAGDQLLCFPYMDNTIPLTFQTSTHLQWLYSPVWSDLVGNPEDRFSHDMAHMYIELHLYID